MRRAPFIPRDFRAVLALAAAVALLPLFVKNDYVFVMLNVVALNAIVVLGLNILIGSAGQVSFGHAAFAGIAAYASAVATVTYGWPLPLAAAAAILVVCVVSLLLAFPTLRLEGHYLVMATLGFNIIVTIVFTQWGQVTGGPSGFSGIPPITVAGVAFDTDRAFHYLVWGVFLVVLSLALNLSDSRAGRALRAIHEKDLTARVLGVPTHRYKVMTFVLSAALAGVAGVLQAHYLSFISPKTFDMFASVQFVTMAVVGGMGSTWGSLAGAAVLTFLPELLHRAEEWYVLIYGLILTSALVFFPKGVLPAFAGLRPVRAVAARLGREAAAPEAPAPEAGTPVTLPVFAPATAGAASLPPGEILLECRDVTVSFGGAHALRRVDLLVRAGEIVALIGPNGAGKTTLLNVISGLVTPMPGGVWFLGRPITGRPPHEIAKKGLGRTFQAVQMFRAMTVLENMLLGLHARGRAGFFRGALRSPGERAEEARLREEALEMLGPLAHLSGLPAGRLSLLEQKCVEILRALALGPRVLLLDEPVGGLNPRESAMLAQFVSGLRARGMGVVIVEHDMNVVMRLADRVVVLQHGVLAAEGTPREVQQNPLVIEAYLGTGKGAASWAATARHSA